ncbi:6-phosphogluconate phosphatase [Undibacterium sp. YM2]|uniref:HAD-IA family hydrolase n=1 Tax=Undibacterium sp. YM2 TaxID=2058625 RepID=UPI001331C7AC|nr:HAD-IA family hydrolase [Undibacterium sp. YM2]BBB69734.1 6-phosphogluconate phosphatase [Undibacterium sp. YM2]
MNKSACLIFDCDGTLVDSEGLCNLGLQIELQRYGVEEDLAELTQRFRGGKLTDICKALSQQHGLHLGENFIHSYRRTVDKLFDESLQAFPDVIEVLQQLDFPMCIASAGPQQKIRRALSLTGLSKFFGEHIFSSYDISSWKPEPDLFLHAARKMGVAPADCIVIEDSEVGIQAAIAAGMQACWFGDAGEVATYPQVPRFSSMSELPFLLLGLPTTS